MTSINDYMNTEKVEQTQTTQEIVTQQSRSYRLSAKDMEIRDEFVKLKKKTGLTGRIYNWLKNITGTGLGTKKIRTRHNEIRKRRNI